MPKPTETKTREERATETWKQYEEGKQFQAGIKLDINIRTNIDFFEGNQWPKATEKTKHLPRPVINIARMIANNKMSAMNNKPCRIVYEADSREEDTIQFSKFSDYQCKEMGMDALNRRAVFNGVVKGTYIYHVYWDAQAKGRRGKITGATRCEILDPRNVIFCNPAQTDEQKQKWIIIIAREEVDAVRNSLPKGYDKTLIIPDNDENKDKKAQDGTEMCTVLIKYFKIDDEIYCEKSTRSTVIRDAFPLRPDYEKAKKMLYGDADEANASSPDTTGDANKAGGFSSFKPNLYPIAVGQYVDREECIYGISEVEGLVANQKSINLTMAMHLLQIQQESWSKWLVKPDALRGQVISNEPGQNIVDYSKLGDGVKRVGGGQISSLPMQLLDNFINYTRVVTGSTEVMSGEVVSAGMSGAAIAQLQSQAQQPVEENRKAFWRVQEKVGRILEQFYRMYYYSETEYTFKDSSEGKTEYKTERFSASNYEDVEFSVVAKVSAGTTSSPAGDIAVLDALKAEGTLTTSAWIEAYPEDALSDKNHILELIKQSENSQLTQLTALLQDREQQLQTAIEQNAASQRALNAVRQTNNENEQLKQDLALLYNKFRVSDNAARQFKAEGDQYHNDASLFATQLGALLEKNHIETVEKSTNL